MQRRILDPVSKREPNIAYKVEQSGMLEQWTEFYYITNDKKYLKLIDAKKRAVISAMSQTVVYVAQTYVVDEEKISYTVPRAAKSSLYSFGDIPHPCRKTLLK